MLGERFKTKEFQSERHRYRIVGLLLFLYDHGRQVTSFEIAEFFGSAYEKTTTLKKSVNGFYMSVVH